MKVELLPSCTGPASESSGSPQFLSSYCVDEQVAIDAGAIGLVADLQRQRQVRQVFLTHGHLDHVASLPLFIENVHAPGPDCPEVLATAEVLDSLRGDLLNGRTWPDFFQLSQPASAFVTATALEPGVAVERSGLSVTPLPVSHAPGSVGFLVDDGHTRVAFPSDTGPTDAFWQAAAAGPPPAAVFLETSFPDRLAGLAGETGHLWPAALPIEMAKLGRPTRWIIVHRKAAFAEEIRREIEALALPGVEMVQPGFRYEF